MIATDYILNHRHKERILTKQKALYNIRKRSCRRKISKAARAKLEEMIVKQINHEQP
jgi:hypothetical protein